MIDASKPNLKFEKSCLIPIDSKFENYIKPITHPAVIEGIEGRDRGREAGVARGGGCSCCGESRAIDNALEGDTPPYATAVKSRWRTSFLGGKSDDADDTG